MIDRFPHAREVRAPQTRKPTHRVKIGFNRGTAEKPRPGCYNGFVIYQDRLGSQGHYMPDYELMRVLIANNVSRDHDSAVAWRWACRELGLASTDVTYESTKAVVALAKEKERDLPPNVLPQRIEFRLPADAIQMSDGKWRFPGIFDANLGAYKVDGCRGEFCRGDGKIASRWQPDNTRKEIACNPWGADGVPADQWCKYSMPSKGQDDKVKPPVCRAKGTLQVVLGYRVAVMIDGKASTRLMPLSRMADALFEVETTSAEAILHFQSALSYAARVLGGRISGLGGTISYAEQNRMAPHHVGGLVRPTQQIIITLNDWEIEARRAAYAGEHAIDFSAPLLIPMAGDPVAPPVAASAPPRVAPEDMEAEYEEVPGSEPEDVEPAPAEDHSADASKMVPAYDVEADHSEALGLWTGCQRAAKLQRPEGDEKELDKVAREILSDCLAKPDGTPGPKDIARVTDYMSKPGAPSAHHEAAMVRIRKGIEVLATIEADITAAMAAPAASEPAKEELR